MDQIDKDFLSFVGYDDETIAAVDKDLASCPYQPGVRLVREETREPSLVLTERFRESVG